MEAPPAHAERPPRVYSIFWNMEYTVQMANILKPQDVLVLLKKTAHAERHPTFEAMGHSLHLSASQVHRSFARSLDARLAKKGQPGQWHVLTAPLCEFLVHGVRYAFYASEGAPKRGVPTAFGVEPMRSQLQVAADQIPVWPHPQGEHRGPSLLPLSKTAPDAALNDPELHVLLALVDAIRVGRARERRLAEEHLRARLL